MFKYRMILNYYSVWIQILTFVWYALLNIGWIGNHYNVYYSNLLASVGFTWLIVYYAWVRKVYFEISFLVMLAMLHYIPLYLSYKSRRINEFQTLLLTLLVYTIYLILRGTDPFTVYFKDKQPTSFKEIRDRLP